MMLHHRDDSRICDFYTLLYLYELFTSASEDRKKTEELEGSWRSAGKTAQI